MVALGLPASFAVIRSRINHLLRSTFLSIAFRTFFFVFFLFFAMQLSIFLNSSTEEKGCRLNRQLKHNITFAPICQAIFLTFSIFIYIINGTIRNVSAVSIEGIAVRPPHPQSLLIYLYNNDMAARRPFGRRAALFSDTKRNHFKNASNAVFIFSNAFSADASSFARTE